MYLVVLNADLVQESVHWKIVADAGLGAVDAVVQDMMLLCAGFFAQQDSELEKAVTASFCHLGSPQSLVSAGHTNLATPLHGSTHHQHNLETKMNDKGVNY